MSENIKKKVLSGGLRRGIANKGLLIRVFSTDFSSGGKNHDFYGRLDRYFGALYRGIAETVLITPTPLM